MSAMRTRHLSIVLGATRLQPPYGPGQPKTSGGLARLKPLAFVKRLAFVKYLAWVGMTAIAVHAAPAFAESLPPGDQGDVLSIPGLPGVRMPPGVHLRPRGDVQGTMPERPDADIYHEYGTVTPGGGRRHAAPLDPYGGTVIGPGGVVTPRMGMSRKAPEPAKPRQMTPAERQAHIRDAMKPSLPLADAKRKTLDDLYAKLAAAKDEDEAQGYASLIEAIWARSGSDTANLLVSRADDAIAKKNYPLALEVLDRVVDLQPNWAEAWNKRAAVRYLAGDIDGSMADVDHVLKIEPRHFAALEGMGAILERSGLDRRALQVYRRALAIYPLQPQVKKVVNDLSLKVEGQGI